MFQKTQRLCFDTWKHTSEITILSSIDKAKTKHNICKKTTAVYVFFSCESACKGYSDFGITDFT